MHFGQKEALQAAAAGVAGRFGVPIIPLFTLCLLGIVAWTIVQHNRFNSRYAHRGL